MKVQYVFLKDQPGMTKDEPGIITDHPGRTKVQTGSTKCRLAKNRLFHYSGLFYTKISGKATFYTSAH